MTCSARSFSSVRSSFSSAMSSSSVAPRHRVPAMGCVVASPSRTVTSASGLEPTMSKRSPVGPTPAAAGTCTGSGWWPAARGRRRAAPPGTALEPLRHHDLERLARPDLLLRDLDGGVVLGGRAPAGERGLGGLVDRHRGRRGRGQLGGHPVEPGHGVVVGLVDALVARVPVDRVGDQRDRALVVVDRGQVGGQQHHQLGDAQVVVGSTRAAAPAGARCRSRGSRPCPPVSGGSPGSGSLRSSSTTVRRAASGSPEVGSPVGHLAGPRELAVDGGERGRADARRRTTSATRTGRSPPTRTGTCPGGRRPACGRPRPGSRRRRAGAA